MSLVTVEIPKIQGRGRKAQDNEYAEPVANLAPNTSALQTAPIPNDQVKTVTAKLDRAGRAAGVTVRKVVTETGQNETSVITFWTVPQIKTRKKDAAPVEASEGAASVETPDTPDQEDRQAEQDAPVSKGNRRK